MNRHRTLLLALLLAPAALFAAEPLRAPLPLRAPVQDKNFYVLSLLERDKGAAGAIAADAELQALGKAKQEALHTAGATCEVDVECFLAAMRLSDAEVARAGTALRGLGEGSAAIRQLVDGPLRRSGAYVRYDGKPSGELLAAAWGDAARGINNILDVYGGGKAPRSATIDAVSFDVKSQGFGQMVHTVAASLDEEAPGASLFFQPSLRFALHLLELNRRDEAGRHEPMERGVNAAALRHLKGIRWGDFPYSMIIVPGSGPDRTGWSHSPASKLRLEIAVRRYKAGKAPLLLVSGGYVHPNQTPYCEALEMKKSLIEDFGVPAEAILVDPHARHTTTNLRNAARLIYRYGIPFDRKVLITTDSFHSSYIGGDAFAKRCEEELGYRPVTLLGRVSVFDVEATPRIESLQIDAMDPLDP
jgi:hypothetical protein